jgi:hypothetical protein
MDTYILCFTVILSITDHSFIENGHRQSDSLRRIVFDLDRQILVVSLDLIIELDRNILECCIYVEMSVCSFVHLYHLTLIKPKHESKWQGHVTRIHLDTLIRYSFRTTNEDRAISRNNIVYHGHVHVRWASDSGVSSQIHRGEGGGITRETVRLVRDSESCPVRMAVDCHIILLEVSYPPLAMVWLAWNLNMQKPHPIIECLRSCRIGPFQFLKDAIALDPDYWRSAQTAPLKRLRRYPPIPMESRGSHSRSGRNVVPVSRRLMRSSLPVDIAGGSFSSSIFIESFAPRNTVQNQESLRDCPWVHRPVSILVAMSAMCSAPQVQREN